jgi:hypothetical protein
MYTIRTGYKLALIPQNLREWNKNNKGVDLGEYIGKMLDNITIALWGQKRYVRSSCSRYCTIPAGV